MTRDPERTVAKAFIQLDFYMKVLSVPLTVKSIYETAYKKRLGSYYSDTWLLKLENHPGKESFLNERFTVQSIIETLMKSGYEPFIRVLLREVKRRDIEYTQAYIMGINHFRE